MTVSEQLTDIYFKKENWHVFKMSYDKALNYHQRAYDNGNIHIYEENGIVLGYYERHFVSNVCFLDNVFVENNHRKGKVFKALYKHFFQTLPENIDFIMGEKQKVFGKMQIVRINKESKHGVY